MVRSTNRHDMTLTLLTEPLNTKPTKLCIFDKIIFFFFHSDSYLYFFFSQMEGCVGCSCSQEESLYSAVVQKYDETEAEHVEDTEIDFFFLKGCCKCVNI